MANKIAAMCRGGLVRSASLVHILKTSYGIDSLPIGYDFNSKETLEMVFNWANKIVIMQGEFIKYVPQEYRDKVLICDVGPDTYGNPHNPDLINRVSFWCKENVENKL